MQCMSNTANVVFLTKAKSQSHSNYCASHSTVSLVHWINS